MKFFVEILDIPDVEPRPKPKLLATYEIEARSLEEARTLGLERFHRENPSTDLAMVYGKARPA